MFEQKLKNLNSSRHQAIEYSWFSNPMDWNPINQTLVIATINICTGVFFAAMISLGLKLQQDPASFQLLDVGVAKLVVFLCSLIALLNTLSYLIAIKKRTSVIDWPFFSYQIAFSYVLLILIIGWTTGTYYSDGIVLMLFGFSVCLPLMDLKILSKAFLFAMFSSLVLIFIDLCELAAFSPLFQNPPYDGKRAVFFWYVVRVTAALIGASVLFFITLPAVRRWREREDLYREMSSTDWLTQLTSRRSFIDRCTLEFLKLQRSPGSLACIMIDLDHFKKINDTYGHQAGDRVLIEVSEILLDSAREYDEVGRYGGEEFALLLPETNVQEATNIAERIRSSIESSPIDIYGKNLFVTASLGVAAYPSEGMETFNDLLRKSDDALYKAKNLGRNKVVSD